MNETIPSDAIFETPICPNCDITLTEKKPNANYIKSNPNNSKMLVRFFCPQCYYHIEFICFEGRKPRRL